MFWSFNKDLGIFVTYLLCFYISVLTSCLHVNVPCRANMTNLLFTHKVMVNVKVTKRQNLAQKHNFSSFKGICAEFVKLMFTMFFNVHKRIFCLVFYMTNFLNCIQSGGRTSKAAQNASKHFFSLVFKVIFSHTLLQ